MQMNINDLTGIPSPTQLDEKAIKPGTHNQTISDDVNSIYGMDPSEPGHAEMMEELRVLRRADPALYRKIVNLD